MKLSQVLTDALQELKEHKILYKMEKITRVPYAFGPKSLANREPVNDKIGKRSVWSFPNTQSLNRLVMLGYAEYQDKAKTIIKYIDKDAADADLKRKAAIYDRMMSLQDTPLFEDETDLSLLDLSPEALLELDKEELQILYDNLLSVIYKAFAHIEELEEKR